MTTVVLEPWVMEVFLQQPSIFGARNLAVEREVGESVW
jgi:hypothetical protein